MSEIDREALKILFKQHWSAGMWRMNRAAAITKEEFDYAKSKGLMFDAPRLTHQAIVKRAYAAVRMVDRKAVANAFVASLGSRRLDLRSALGSFAVFQHLPRHKDVVKKGYCPVCGETISAPVKEDLNVLNFERFKWGGVRHLNPLYGAFDLERFKKTTPVRPAPLEVKLLKGILEVIDQSPAKTSAGTLNKLLASSLTSNKDERDVLIAILGYCGILENPKRPGFRKAFIRAESREEKYSEIHYPVCWWKRSDGINAEAVNYWFGHLV